MSEAYTAADIDNADLTTDFNFAAATAVGTTVETDATTLTLTITTSDVQILGDDVNVIATQITDLKGNDFAATADTIE